MGAIARNAANKITTGGVFTSGAITNDSVTGITVLANASDGITLISSQTASASASISFTTGIDSTYKAYKFLWINCHPATDAAHFQFNMSTDGGSNYNVTKTTTVFRAEHFEDDSYTALDYPTAQDLAQSTSFQTISHNIGNSADESSSGSLIIFNPASTVYVKHFIGRANGYRDGSVDEDFFSAGYGNTTSAVNAIQFKYHNGNIDDGKIYLYGIK